MDEEKLNDICEYAAALMSKEEILLILELDEDQIDSDEFKRAFKKGFLKTKYLVNKSTVNLASSGSSPAQTIANKLILGIEEKEVLNG